MRDHSGIEQQKLAIAKYKEDIERRKALKRLTENKDFKALFLQEYVIEYAASKVSMLGNQSEFITETNLVDELKGIASFQRYMAFVNQLGRVAEQQMESSIEALEYLETVGED